MPAGKEQLGCSLRQDTWGRSSAVFARFRRDFGARQSTIAAMTRIFVDVPAFVTVVQEGSFSAAARRLDVSRSAIGKAVARLESRLSARLFHRTTRIQSLTEDGQAFYEHCLRALAELQAGKALLDSGRKGVSGRLRVSMPVLFGRLCVAPVLLRLAATHSELELILGFSDRPADLFEDGFDLAVRMGPLGDGAGLMTRRIAYERMSIFAAPAYLNRHGTPNAVADLKHHQAVTYERNDRFQKWVLAGEDGLPQEVRPPTRLRFDDLGAIVDAASAGFGLAWLPGWLVRERIGSGELVPVLMDIPGRVSEIHAVWPETPFLPRRIRAAIDALAAELMHLTTP